MAVPKKKTSRTRRNRRRANHDRVAAPAVVMCDHCGEPKRPHRVCGQCGHYNGREVVAQPAE